MYSRVGIYFRIDETVERREGIVRQQEEKIQGRDN